MDCMSFEKGLTRLLEGELSEVGRSSCLDELRRHAASCDPCSGSESLLDLMGLPPGERDLVSPPPAAYWEDFSDRVARRIDGSRGAGRARRLWGLAAAALLLAAVGTWTLRPTPVEVGPETPFDALGEATADVDVGWYVGWDVDAEGAAEGDEGVEGPSGARWSDGLFPDTSDMTSEARRELLEWLREASS